MWCLSRNLLPVGIMVLGGMGAGLASAQTPATATPAAAETKAEPSSSERSQRLPVPAEAVQKETLKMVQAIYGGEIKDAKTRQQKQALAEKMLHMSRQMSGDTEGRFALLEIAQEMAAQAGNVKTALEAAEQMASLYAVDGLKLRAKALAQLFKTVDDLEARKIVIQQARRLMDEAAVAEHYQIVQQVGAEAQAATRKVNDRELTKSLTNQIKYLKKQAAALANFEQGRQTLASDPADEEANSAVGRYLCLVRNDWEHGLPNLAKGPDGPLKTLAQRELTSPPADMPGQMELADAWWDLSQMTEGRQSLSLKLHACTWYRRAQEKLPDSLLKAKAEKRLAETAAEAAPKPPEQAEAPTGEKAAEKAESVPPKKARGSKTRAPAKVVEGVGWEGFQVGATREELTKAYGAPDPRPSSNSVWAGWLAQYHIDCLFDRGGHATEVRFNRGFTLPLASGVKIGDAEKDVLSAYGNPDRVVNKPESKMLEYGERGVLLWVNDGKVHDFTVFHRRGTAPVAADRPTQKAKVRLRVDRDRATYSEEQMKEIDTLYRTVHDSRRCEDAWKSLKLLLEKYRKANRTGCAVLQFGQMSQRREKIAYYQQAIVEYSDCFYGDGTQVGAYARFLLAHVCLKMGKPVQAKMLFDEIRRDYPDSIDHGGRSLVKQLPP